MIDNNINKWFHSIFYRERLVKGRGIVEDWKTRLQIKYPSLQSNISRVNIYHIVIKLLIIYCDSPITDNHRIFNRRIDDRSERKSIMTFNLRHTTCLRSIRLIMTYSHAVTIGYICSYTMICIKRVMITQWFFLYTFRSRIYKVLTLSSSILLLLLLFQKKVVIRFIRSLQFKIIYNWIIVRFVGIIL